MANYYRFLSHSNNFYIDRFLWTCAVKGTRRPCLNQAIQVFDRIHLSDALMRLSGLLVYSSKINKSFFLSKGQNSSITELLRMKNPATSSRYSKRRRLTMLLHALVSLVAFTYLHKKYITEIQRRNCCSMCIVVPKCTKDYCKVSPIFTMHRFATLP